MLVVLSMGYVQRGACHLVSLPLLFTFDSFTGNMYHYTPNILTGEMLLSCTEATLPASLAYCPFTEGFAFCERVHIIQSSP